MKFLTVLNQLTHFNFNDLGIMTQGNTELLMPLRIETVQHDVGLDGGGRPDADLEEGVRQVTSADVEEGGVSVRQIFSFHCMKFQSSMKKIFRG